MTALASLLKSWRGEPERPIADFICRLCRSTVVRTGRQATNARRSPNTTCASSATATCHSSRNKSPGLVGHICLKRQRSALARRYAMSA